MNGAVRQKEEKMKKKLVALMLSASMVFALAGCGEGAAESAAEPETSASDSADAAAAEGSTFKVGLCNYVADASLDQALPRKVFVPLFVIAFSPPWIRSARRTM